MGEDFGELVTCDDHGVLIWQIFGHVPGVDYTNMIIIMIVITPTVGYLWIITIMITSKGDDYDYNYCISFSF